MHDMISWITLPRYMGRTPDISPASSEFMAPTRQSLTSADADTPPQANSCRVLYIKFLYVVNISFMIRHAKIYQHT